MLKSTLLNIIVLMHTSSSVGTWVNPDGTLVEAECPSILEYSDRVLLPESCRVEVPGVWLSTARYKDLEVSLAEARSEVSTQAEYIRVLKNQLKEAQNELLICKTVPPCSPCAPCKTNSFTEQIGVMAIGATISAGGCLLLLQNR